MTGTRRTGATYFTLREGNVAQTVHISDLIFVDVADDGAPVGVEFAVDPQQATAEELAALGRRSLGSPDLQMVSLLTAVT